MNVLYLSASGTGTGWFDGVCRACEDIATIRLFDPNKSLDEQFAGTDVVVDEGGHGAAKGKTQYIDAGRRHGVRLWQILSTGTDYVDVEYLLQSGFQVAYTPGVYSAIALAEHALFLMLSVVKQFPATQRDIAERVRYARWVGELDERTLGLIGFGASARELARRARGLGMHVLAIDVTTPAPVDLNGLNVQFLGGPENLRALLQQSDVVSLHVPLSPSTRNLIDREALSWMKPHAILINVARGELVDEDALLEALEHGQIEGAGLDVFASEPVDPRHPLLQRDNVVGTPHVAGCSEGTSRRRGRAVAENIARVAQGLPALHQIMSAG